MVSTMLKIIRYFRKKVTKKRLKKAIERDRAETERKRNAEKEKKHGVLCECVYE